MENPPPLPQPPPQPIPPPPRSSGCGCFATGCMGLLAAGFVGLILLGVGSWFLYVKAVNAFTSDRPADIALVPPSEAEFAAAEGKLEQLRSAMRSEGQAATVAFTAADLNALIAHHPDFASKRGKMRIGMADSIATVEMSVPLAAISWPRLKKRWFNGSMRFRFAYDDEAFLFDPEWIEANGHRLSGKILRAFSRDFNPSFTRGFKESIEKEGNDRFWQKVDSIKVEGDQLIITTRGESGLSV